MSESTSHDEEAQIHGQENYRKQAGTAKTIK